MVERRSGGAVVERQTQRPKRRRLNQDTQQSRPSRTPTRTSPRLSRNTTIQKRTSSTNWETELPNATAALDGALSKIASCRVTETRDLCDEIADYLTQALFEDIWRCNTTKDLLQKSNTGHISDTELKTDKAKHQEDREKVEPNLKDSGALKQTFPPPNAASLPQIIVLNPIAPTPTVPRCNPEKRKRDSNTRRTRPKEKSQDQKDQSVCNNKKNTTPNSRTMVPVTERKRSSKATEPPPNANHHEGLVEEVIEIEEDFVDGGFAFDRNKLLQGHVEEQVLDRSGSRSAQNSAVKNAIRSSGIGRTTHRKETLQGDVEEQVLDRSGEKSAPNSEGRNAVPEDGLSRRLPWWCVSDANLEAISKSEKEVLRSYVTAIFRTCIRESWNAETLRESYRRDPNSNRGQAFRAVHEALQLLEQAKHVKECESRWRPELMRELLQRQEMDWSIVKHDKKFDQFVGCDACLGHRQATARIWLKGKRYDASNFWPGTSRFRVVSSEQVSDRKLLVSAELRNGSTNDHLIRIGANEDDTEFWVDAHCLRKCLLFHELVHSTASIARDFRRIIDKELGKGTVELKLSSRESNGNGTSVSERLERSLLRSVLHNKEYVHNHVDHLTDIIRLGDVYFSSPDAEVLDSGKPGKSVYVPSIYDAPLDLGDEEYRQRIDAVVAHSRRKKQSKH